MSGSTVDWNSSSSTRVRAIGAGVADAPDRIGVALGTGTLVGAAGRASAGARFGAARRSGAGVRFGATGRSGAGARVGAAGWSGTGVRFGATGRSSAGVRVGAAGRSGTGVRFGATGRVGAGVRLGAAGRAGAGVRVGAAGRADPVGGELLHGGEVQTAGELGGRRRAAGARPWRAARTGVSRRHRSPWGGTVSAPRTGAKAEIRPRNVGDPLDYV